MKYSFRGRLCGYICEECIEPLANVEVRLYRPGPDRDVTMAAIAAPKETFAILDAKQIQERTPRLLGRATTDEQGRFSVEIDQKGYDGGPFEIDVYCGTVPRPKVDPRAKPQQFSITTLQPRWRASQEVQIAVWEYCVPSRWWCRFLSLFGVWTICGRLTTCEGGVPVPGATVNAFDADWLQDDPLGSAVTDGSGRFLIFYTASDFQKTPLSPFINFESIGGPDVYFTAELAGNPILTETQATGRTPGRENVGPCFCVDLCTKEIIGTPETVPHWQRVEVFNIHPPAGAIGSSFSIEGYAGDPNTQAFAFGGSVVLQGNCPLTNVGTGNSLEYRFMIGEWGWATFADDPATMPSVAPVAMTPVTQVVDARVGYVQYTDGNGILQWADVVVGAGDLLADGWAKVDGKPVTVQLYNPPGATAVVNVSSSNFLRTFDLLTLNTPAITAAHPAKLPGGLPKADAGRTITGAEREPIRRYTLRFEVRDTGGAKPIIYTDTLSSIILDNSPVIRALDLEELRANACNPLAGVSQIHILYTVDHPHLNWFGFGIANNNGSVHPPGPMPGGSFGGSFFFRGGQSGSHNPTPPPLGGTNYSIAGDPPCAYALTLSWQTRVYKDPVHSIPILYCT